MKFIAYTTNSGALICRRWTQEEKDATELQPANPSVQMGANVIAHGPIEFEADDWNAAWAEAERRLR